MNAPTVASARVARRRRALRWGGALLLLVAAGAGWRVLRRPVPVDVRVTPIVRGRAEAVVTSTRAGAVRSRLVATLSVQAAGIVTAVHAREGQRVAAGGPLVSLDDEDERALVTLAEREQAVLRALAAEAGARLADARRELARMEQLRRDGTATAAQLDQARTLHDVHVAAQAAAAARVEAQAAAVERARIALGERIVRAPFAGVVADRWVEVGEWVAPGQRALRLIDLDRLYVRAEIDEVDLGRLRAGLTARARLDPWDARLLGGRLVRVAPCVSEVEEQNRTVEVEAELTDGLEGLTLLPGTSADLEVVLEARDGALLAPTAALLEGDRVLTVGADGVLRAVALRIGLRNWEKVEVLDGLAEGAPIVVSLDSEAVREGVLARVVAERGR